MAKKRSLQDVIAKTPKGPRVVIGMQVDEVGGTPREEIPFVLGVLAALSGDAEKAPFEDQEPVTVTSTSLNQAVASIRPGLSFSVDSVLENAKPGDRLPVNLTFNAIEDFEPQQVAKQVPALNEQLERRQQLRSLLGLLRANPRLARKIEDVVAQEFGNQGPSR